MTKNEKKIKKFKKNFSFFFKDKYLSPLLKEHFDNNGSFITFIISFLTNKFGLDRTVSQLRINQDEWSLLFCHLYENKDVVDTYKKLEINPAISLNDIEKSFDCFDAFLNELIKFLSYHEFKPDLTSAQIKSLLKTNLGYLLYNKINHKIAYHFKDVLTDIEYDTKYTFVLYNTKLFSKAKQEILNYCGDKINDLIEVLLGLNQQLNLDK